MGIECRHGMRNGWNMGIFFNCVDFDWIEEIRNFVGLELFFESWEIVVNFWNLLWDLRCEDM